MKRIVLLAFGIFCFVTWMGLANGKEPGRILRDDCHMSFFSPGNLEYVEIDDAITTGKDECYIAFKYTGDMQIKSEGQIPAVPDDWRAMTDFSLTVKSVSLSESLAQIESSDGARQNGLFDLVSKEHIQLPEGELYILSYFAIKPTANMNKLRQSREVIFIAGNDMRSISFFLYSGNKLKKMEKRKERVFRDLFSSFRFFY